MQGKVAVFLRVVFFTFTEFQMSQPLVGFAFATIDGIVARATARSRANGARR